MKNKSKLSAARGNDVTQCCATITLTAVQRTVSSNAMSAQTEAEPVATALTWALALYPHRLGSLEPKVHVTHRVLLKRLTNLLKENDASTFLGGVSSHESFEVQQQDDRHVLFEPSVLC